MTGFRNDTNVVRVVAPEWLAWLRLARRDGLAQPGASLRPASPRGEGSKSATGTPTEVSVLWESRALGLSNSCRKAAGDPDRGDRASIGALGGPSESCVRCTTPSVSTDWARCSGEGRRAARDPRRARPDSHPPPAGRRGRSRCRARTGRPGVGVRPRRGRARGRTSGASRSLRGTRTGAPEGAPVTMSGVAPDGVPAGGAVGTAGGRPATGAACARRPGRPRRGAGRVRAAGRRRGRQRDEDHRGGPRAGRMGGGTGGRRRRGPARRPGSGPRLGRTPVRIEVKPCPHPRARGDQQEIEPRPTIDPAGGR